MNRKVVGRILGLLIVGGAVVAIDTNDRTAVANAPKIDVQGVDAKIAALVGLLLILPILVNFLVEQVRVIIKLSTFSNS